MNAPSDRRDQRPTIFLTNRIFPDVISFLEKHGRVIANPNEQPYSREEIFQKASDASALMVFMNDWLDAAALDRCPNLRIIAAALKGSDNFDVNACTERGIWFTIVPDLLTIPTVELAIALALGLARKVRAGDRMVRSGRFAGWRPVLYGSSLYGHTAGMVGMGNLGRALAKRLQCFEMKLFYADPVRLPAAIEAELRIEKLELADLLANSDFVFLLLPLSPRTTHLIGRVALASMRTGSFLVNVGRGSVVDEQAVADALASGRLGGYAADVFEMEDWARPDRPKSIYSPLLVESGNTLFTPHLGSAVSEIRHAMEMRAAQNIVDALNGLRPSDAINEPKHR
jgi:phosphonate dehydrogenase